MSAEVLSVSPTLDIVVKAFAKLLAPPPYIFVFDDLKGYWFATLENPITFQVYVGVSPAMLQRIRKDVWEVQGRELGAWMSVEHVKGRTQIIHLQSTVHVLPEGYLVANPIHRPPYLELVPREVPNG